MGAVPDGRRMVSGDKAEVVSGTVEHVTYRNREDTFHVVAVRDAGTGRTFAARSSGEPLWPGQSVVLRGRWVSHPEHGRQFESSDTAASGPTSEEGMRAYLCSGRFKGLGKVKAGRLVALFGAGTLDALRTQEARIATLPGFGGKSARGLARQAGEAAGPGQADELFLRGLGLGAGQLRQLRAAHGDRGAAVLRDDPYRAIEDVDRVAFLTADGWAVKGGLAPDSPVRLRAGLLEAARLAVRSPGHTVLPAAELERRARALLGVPAARVAAEAASLCAAGRLARVEYRGAPAWALPSLDRGEREIAAALAARAGRAPRWAGLDVGRALAVAEREMGKRLDASQREAFGGVVGGMASIVTGGPGVGKTTLLRAILRSLAAMGLKVAACAPTGRAAVRMTEATGLPASTVHMMLGSSADGGGFQRGRGCPLDADVVAMDESTMTDVPLMAAVVAAMRPDAALLLLGDADQLEPVGPGQPYADAIASGRVPVWRLTRVHRQAAGSRIVTGSHEVNQGRIPDFGDPATSDLLFLRTGAEARMVERVLDLVGDRIPARFGLDPTRDVQVLSPQRTGALGTDALNAALQGRLNPPGPRSLEWGGQSFSRGDKVIHARNNYGIKVMNGEIGVVDSVDRRGREASVSYGGRVVGYDRDCLDELRLGWAISIHKSQGSEFQAVVIPMTMGHAWMWRRRMLYTGMSRGRRFTGLVGQPEALAKAVEDARVEARHTRLPELLRAA